MTAGVRDPAGRMSKMKDHGGCQARIYNPYLRDKPALVRRCYRFLGYEQGVDIDVFDAESCLEVWGLWEHGPTLVAIARSLEWLADRRHHMETVGERGVW